MVYQEKNFKGKCFYFAKYLVQFILSSLLPIIVKKENVLQTKRKSA